MCRSAQRLNWAVQMHSTHFGRHLRGVQWPQRADVAEYGRTEAPAAQLSRWVARAVDVPIAVA
jgi:hypothetical protein